MTQRPGFRANLAHAVASNAMIGAVSALSTFVVPKVLGVEEYGYWQLSVFYGSYVLLLQFGAGDGANLRYGGFTRRRIATRALGPQAILLLLLTTVLGLGLFLAAPWMTEVPERVWVIRFTAAFAMIANIRHFVLVQLQAVADFRAYSRNTVADRLAFVVLVAAMLLLGFADFRLLAAAEIAAKIFSTALAVRAARDILAIRRGRVRFALGEFGRNVVAGAKLTIATTATMLILGIARFSIDRVFGVAVFGGISLLLNLSSFFMIFVNAVGVVLFPTLRRLDRSRLPQVFAAVRPPLTVPPLAFLILAYPLVLAAQLWLPQYASTVTLLPLVLPMIVFESRMGLLVVPYLKALRGENVLLLSNLVALAVSAALSLVGGAILASPQITVLSIVVALAVRVTVAETVLLRLLGLGASPGLWIEVALVGVSTAAHLTLGGWWATLVFGMALAVYLVAVRRSLITSVRWAIRFLHRP